MRIEHEERRQLVGGGVSGVREWWVVRERVPLLRCVLDARANACIALELRRPKLSNCPDLDPC